MKPRIKVITLGVNDLEKSLAFYRDGMGLATVGIIGTEFEDGAVVFFDMNDDLILALYPRAALAKDAKVAVGPSSPTEFSIGHNVKSKQEVHAVISRQYKQVPPSLTLRTTAFGEGTPDTSRIWTATSGKSPGILTGKSRNRVPVGLLAVHLRRALRCHPHGQARGEDAAHAADGHRAGA